MPHQHKCTSCDEMGEHWHWEGEPFLSRNYRAPCNSCGGKKVWYAHGAHELAPLVDRLSLAQLIRLDVELHFDLSPPPDSLTLRFIRFALRDAVRERLRFHFKLSERTLWGWWWRIRYGRRNGNMWSRSRKGVLPA